MMKNNSKTAFIIVTWNNQDIIEDCLKSVNSQSKRNIEIYIVDNNSKDKTVDKVKSKFPKAKIIANPKNLGFAKGNNIGIKAALKDKGVANLVLLNSDAWLDKDWLKQILDFAKDKPRAAMIQGLTLDFYNHSVIDSTNIYVNHSGQAAQAGYGQPLRASGVNNKKVFGVNAAATWISRGFIEANPFSDFFDQSFFMYLEDVDIAFRANLLGWNNYFCKDAVAYHMGSYSSKSLGSYSLYMTYRNNLPLLFKNLSWRYFFRTLPKLIASDRLSIRQLRLAGERHLARQIIRGRLVGLIRLPLYLIKKLRIQNLRKISNEYLWYLMTNPD